MAIKVRIGKLDLDEPLSELLARELPEFEVLPISVEHAVMTASLSLHHRDPFDRILAAQALLDELPLISVDSIFDRYGVERLWTSATDP
jgi:PIN domain nuclease of toxin-antitoxin system